MITAIDIRYLNALISLPELPIIRECPECGDRMPQGYLDLCNWSERHTVIDTREKGATQCRPTLVIGCEGYHLIDSATGREKDHDD
jgi:hypothetical protein